MLLLRGIEGGYPSTARSGAHQYQQEELKEQLLSHLIESNPFEPPPSMVERQTRYLLERNPIRMRTRLKRKQLQPRKKPERP